MIYAAYRYTASNITGSLPGRGVDAHYAVPNIKEIAK